MEKRDFIDANNIKIDIAKQLSDMFNSKGWIVVEEMVKMSKANLLNSNNEELVDNFNRYKVLKDFVSSLEDMVNDAETAIEDNDNLK